MTKMKQRKKTLFVSLLLAVVILCTSVQPVNASVMGIDVSKFQGAIDWNTVAKSGVSFAFIKAGSTKGGVDPTFVNNIVNAQAAGIRTGVYIYSYAMSVEEAVAEAQLLLQWIEPFHVNYPVVFDIENNTQKKLDPITVTTMCNAFCDVIAAAGYYPMVYTYTNFYKAHMTPALRYDKWIAQYAKSCDIPGYSIWQGSCTGRVPGIAGDVDINWLMKDYNSIIIPVGFTQRGNNVYFYNDYRMQFGWVNYLNSRYHMGPDGVMNTGWFLDETGAYFLAADGHALIGQNQVDKDFYYFNELGALTTGWVDVLGNRFYYDPVNGGKMLRGWFTDETGIHYLALEDGHMLRGAATIDKKNFLFNELGSMLTGWQTVAGQNFYYNPVDGSMYYGWLGDLTNRYYLSTTDGHMVTGLQVIDGQTYLFNEKGIMQTGWQAVNGQTFYFNPADGSMMKGLIAGTDGIYYTSEKDGHKVVNELVTINNIPFIFDEAGRLVAGRNYTLNGVLYVCDANGLAVPVGALPATP